jgi:hypothetical protein
MVLVAIGLVLVALPNGARSQSLGEVPAVPRAVCGPGSNPEPGLQGRAVAAGSTCNTEQVSHFGESGGYKVERFVDQAGHECAFYDSTLLFPTNVLNPGSLPTGTYVLDMTDPAHPVHTDTLMTLAMQSPHESLLLNARRGLLAAVMGNPIVAPGIVDIYDVNADCRHPVLQSSSPLGILGHESGFSPDGNTFYATSLSNGSITALDITNPAAPVPLWLSDLSSHGLMVSDDGNRAYLAARTGNGSAGNQPGLTIIDTSEIQSRAANPQPEVISRLTWPGASVPQIAIPVTIGGHPYVVEMDEFAGAPIPSSDPAVPPGAARIIDIADERNPQVVSNIRLDVHTAAGRLATAGDPGADSPLQGYAGHYCAVPQRTDPGIVACSFILSGLRVFDIRDPLQPKEIAYFNPPANGESSFAMSAPTFVPARSEIWYTDGNRGFYAVRITNNVWPFPAAAPAAAPTTQPAAAPAAATRGQGLPATGARFPMEFGALTLALAVLVRRLARTPSLSRK